MMLMRKRSFSRPCVQKCVHARLGELLRVRRCRSVDAADSAGLPPTGSPLSGKKNFLRARVELLFWMQDSLAMKESALMHAGSI
jgi:hypothetical protein